MYIEDIIATLKTLRQATNPGKPDGENGQLISIQYSPIAGPDTRSAAAKAKSAAEALRAKELGLPLNTYTGRVSRVWEAANGDTILNMYVLLERAGKYRSFNVNAGAITAITVLEK